ncbi:MAG TPA: hypothetical protein VNC22_10415 [Sporichthya sp.]|jgi:hypothetical protein|nr:hypothetical protein [Sporichthya sp.]
MPDNTVVPVIPTACFAPPLDDGSLARYRSLAEGVGDPEARDWMLRLLECVERWWELPESTRPPKRVWEHLVARTPREGEAPRPRGEQPDRVTFDEVPLEEEHIKELFDLVPWMRELNALSTPQGDGPFDALPNGPARDAAFHLLWHAKELTLDREPLTLDKLKRGGAKKG